MRELPLDLLRLLVHCLENAMQMHVCACLIKNDECLFKVNLNRVALMVFRVYIS